MPLTPTRASFGAVVPGGAVSHKPRADHIELQGGQNKVVFGAPLSLTSRFSVESISSLRITGAHVFGTKNGTTTYAPNGPGAVTISGRRLVVDTP